MTFDQPNLDHDALVMEAARAIAAAQRAVRAASYGDYHGYHAAALEHFRCAARVSQMEDMINAQADAAAMQGFGSIFSKIGKAVSKVVSKATQGVKTAGLVVAAGASAIGKPIERALPKPIVGIGKAIVNTALVPTKLVGGLLTNPNKTISRAPGMIFATPLTSAMKITGSTAQLVGLKSAGASVNASASQLQTYSEAHPLKTLATVAAVAAVVVGGVVAAPYIGAALTSSGTAAASTAVAAETTAVAGGAAAAAGGTTLYGTATAAAIAAGEEALKKKAVSAGKSAVNSVIGGGGGSYPSQPQAYPQDTTTATPQDYTAETQTILNAIGIQTPSAVAPKPGQNMGVIAAGLAVGFVTAGPIGAAIGAIAAGALSQKKAGQPVSSPAA